MAVSTEKTLQERVDEFLNQQNFFTDQLNLVETKTGVNKKYIFSGLVAAFGVFLVYGFAPGLFVSLIGFLYPAYSSVKAIESTEKDDDTKMLTYWVVYATFHIAEFFSDVFLSWFPLYYLFKCLFLCWCMAPFSWNGSIFLYHNVIRPFVLEHEKDFDKLIKKGKDMATEVKNKTEAELKKAAVEQVLKTEETTAEPTEKQE